MPAYTRMEILQQRSSPNGIARGRGTQEHVDLRNALDRGPRGKLLEPGPDHPLYDEYMRLTAPRKPGRQPAPQAPPKDPEVIRQEQAEYLRNYRRDRETAEQRQRNIDQTAKRIQLQRRTEQAKQFYGIDDQDAAEMLAEQYPPFTEFPPPLTTEQYEQEGKTRWWPEYTQGKGKGLGPIPDAFGNRVTHVLQRAAADTWEERISATKAKPKPKPPRKPEEVWYDVHKHPDGVPGGMGKSPEHHLRNRGWNGHEINEGSGKKTIQYRNHQFPDFVISYGGGSGTKPDHNFRILYMGTNRNIPKVTRSYSVAEAMNKVEELQKLESGHVVQPMIYDSAVSPVPVVPKPPSVPGVPKPAKPRDMNDADSYPEFPNRPQGVSESWNDRHEKQLQEIPDPPAFGPEARARAQRAASILEMAQQDSWEQ
jgi:hypothetical protein